MRHDKPSVEKDNERKACATPRRLRELEKLGDLAIPALQKRLPSSSSLEGRRREESLLEGLARHNLTADQIRVVRAIEVLDKIGTNEARQVLERLAGGAPGALTTRHAQMSLQRFGGIKN